MAEQANITNGAGLGARAGNIVLALAAVVAFVSLAYNYLGSDEETVPAEVSEFPDTIEELQAAAKASLDDALPWQELGYVHFTRGEFSEAALAYQSAVEIEPKQAVLWAALGEAKVMASKRDPMPKEALEAFQKAISLDPKEPRARYFLNVQKDLDGDHDGAIAGWLDLLADTPPGAPWDEDLQRTIQQVGKMKKISVENRLAAVLDGRQPAPVATRTSSLPGPTQEQLAEAGKMRPSEQREMAEGMVERLEQRLANDPSNLDGWLMLIRSRVTLGEAEKAKAALNEAVAANPDYEANLRSEAGKLGVR